jgi:lipoate---protein ligase
MSSNIEPSFEASGLTPPSTPAATAPTLDASLASISVFDQTLTSVEENLALDEALLMEADDGRAGAVLRFWESPRLAVVLGASRRIAEDVRLDDCIAGGVPIVRRSSGGGTVLIGPGALNVTLVLPGDPAAGLAAVDTAQHFVLARMASALGAPERPVEVLGSGDLTIAGRKFAGSAQRRLRSWFLVHCSILYAFPLPLIARYLNVPSRQPAYRAGRTHDEFLMNLGLPRTIILSFIQSVWCPSLSLCPAPDVPYDVLRTLLSAKFANRSWVERF